VGYITQLLFWLAILVQPLPFPRSALQLAKVVQDHRRWVDKRKSGKESTRNSSASSNNRWPADQLDLPAEEADALVLLELGTSW
jgi:hypothetical protein